MSDVQNTEFGYDGWNYNYNDYNTMGMVNAIGILQLNDRDNEPVRGYKLRSFVPTV